MAHPDVTVLLARQRSGTNALLSVLGTHPDIFCFDEVFRRDDLIRPDPVQIRGNYFNFLEAYAQGDVTRIFPDRHEQVLDAFLSHLRRLSPKRLLVVDVKYNSTHHLSGMWRPIGRPTLFDWLKDRGVAVLHLTRRHYLRCLLSTLKAWDSKRYYVRDARVPEDASIQVPPGWALEQMERWRLEDEGVASAFTGYAHGRMVDYAELFADASGTMARRALEDLRDWFGVTGAFVSQPSLSKQSSLPLRDTVENFEELRAALRGSAFEYCLDDEPAYRTPAAR